MFSLRDKLTFVNIDQDYLEYLHENCSEVFYKPIGYDNKPYIGILINEDENKYVIPLSSAKEKHKFWNNVEEDRFLIYEISNKKPLSKNAVFKELSDGTVEQIFSVIDLKKNAPDKRWPIYES